MALELVVPALAHLSSYTAALRRRWSPNTMRPEAADEELAAIEVDAAAFVASRDHRSGSLPPVVQPDGTTKPRVPGFTQWLWDDEFVGSINLRWQPGTTALPPHVPGHIGYSIVPWMRRRGHATTALGLLLPMAAAFDLPHVDLTTDSDNLGSRRVIEANGGVLVGRHEAPDGHSEDLLLYRIDLAPRSAAGSLPRAAPDVADQVQAPME